MIPYGLGQNVEFKKGLGPNLDNINLNNIININPTSFIEKLLPVYRGIEKVKNETKKKGKNICVSISFNVFVKGNLGKATLQTELKI